MRILTVAPGPTFSTYDTFVYYTEAFRELGHTVFSFNYHDHYAYHATALAYLDGEEDVSEATQGKAITMAAEDLIARVARKQPDLIFIVSGLALPPGVWDWLKVFNSALSKKFVTMVLFTESPYVDEMQIPILQKTDYAATTDLASLDKFLGVNGNSIYIKHAHSPKTHAPQPMSEEHAADVFMVGTGFPERVDLLSSVNWDGIDFRLFGGNWADSEKGESALGEYYEPEFLENSGDVVKYYANSKVCVNIFRTAKWPGDNVIHIDPKEAYSISPRCYEIMGCGGFLLTDGRPELLELFEDGKELVVFDGADDFEEKLKYYLTHPRQREKIAMAGLRAVSEHTYVSRAAEIVEYLENNK